MPNWCGNLLTVTGPRDERTRLVKLLREPNVFEQTLPMPQSFSAEDMVLIGEMATRLVNSGYPGSGSIRVEDCDEARDLFAGLYWGTRTDTDGDGNSISVHDSEEATRISFDTAYSPPAPVIKELSRQYPTLAFRLVWDDGSGDAGEAEYVAGAGDAIEYRHLDQADDYDRILYEYRGIRRELGLEGEEEDQDD
jgi:hypothetical protein